MINIKNKLKEFIITLIAYAIASQFNSEEEFLKYAIKNSKYTREETHEIIDQEMSRREHKNDD